MNTATATARRRLERGHGDGHRRQTRTGLLDKSAAPATYDPVGEVITYTYVVTNTGNVTLGGPVTVIDDKATVACPVRRLAAPGASVTCTATYTITQADLDAGSVTNTATATVDGIDSNEDTRDRDATQTPDLALEKTVTPETYDAVGDELTYSYVVTNTGNVTLTGPVTVVDDKATVTARRRSSLAPARPSTCTATYTVTQADLDAGSVMNTATATSTARLERGHARRSTAEADAGR